MFSNPEENLRQFGIGTNMIVADLGAGTGFYSLHASKMVPGGKVYAIEVVPDYLKTIQNKIKDAHITNIDCILGDVESIGGTKIKDGIVDRVIASNIFFQVENKDKFIEEIKRILKPGGKILLIDWLLESSMVGRGHGGVFAKDKVKELLEGKDLIYEGEVDAGEHHYGMIYRK